MAVTAPADKRFRRARVSPARRRRVSDVVGRRLIAVALAVAVAAYGGYRILQSVLASSALTIERINVSGNTALSGDDVRSRLAGVLGRNMMTIDLGEWQQKVLESPWIETASIRRAFPRSINVSVIERRPMGLGRVGNSLYLIDQDGGVIDEYGPSHGDFDLPLIDGLAAGDSSRRAPVVDERRAALAGRLMASLQEWPDMAARVSQIDVTNPRDAVVILKGDTVLIRVGTDQFAERIQSYLDIASTLRGQVPDIDYVDLRFGEKVYVRPLPSRGGVRKSAGGE